MMPRTLRGKLDACFRQVCLFALVEDAVKKFSSCNNGHRARFKVRTCALLSWSIFSANIWGIFHSIVVRGHSRRTLGALCLCYGARKTTRPGDIFRIDTRAVDILEKRQHPQEVCLISVRCTDSFYRGVMKLPPPPSVWYRLKWASKCYPQFSRPWTIKASSPYKLRV